VARLVRKNLMVDAEALSELAEKRGTSESQAVREAVQMALGAQEIIAAIQGLHDMGAFADFETLFPPLEADLEVEAELVAQDAPRRRSGRGRSEG
jgi:hypothetical protein